MNVIKENNMSIYADLTQLGEDIDKLQQLNYNGIPLAEICSEINAIETKFLNESKWIGDLNNQIVFCYPAIGYRTELLKSAMRSAYGVLDKIGLLCNDFVSGKNMPTKKISFINWFDGIEERIQIYNRFTPLYWVAKDISKDGAFVDLRKMRNVIEHRYLRVVDCSKTSLEKELSDDNKMEYTVSFSELMKQTYRILRLIRALLFYVVIAFNSCYLEAMEMVERENKIFIPLTLDFYDDEWKN